MRIAYLTIDEVNESLAVAMAAACGLALDPRWPRDWPCTSWFDAVVYDLDHLPPELRQDILRALAAGPVGVPTAVHSYHLDEDAVDVLRQNGVVVERRLEVGLFEALRAGALATAAAVSEEVILVEVKGADTDAVTALGAAHRW